LAGTLPSQKRVDSEHCSNGRINGFESDGLSIVTVDEIADPIKIMEITNKIGPIMDAQRTS